MIKFGEDKMKKILGIFGLCILAVIVFMFTRPYKPVSTIKEEPAWVKATVFLRDGLLHLHLLKNNETREFYLGQFKEGTTVDEIKNFLEMQGFAADPFAWEKKNEVVNYRKTDDKGYQYHVSVFSNDRGVYGHHEFIPEEFPLKHWENKNMESRHEEFIRMLSPILAGSTFPKIEPVQ